MYELLPSCWGTFRRPTISSPVAGERFADRDFLPSCWGTFRTPRFPPQLLGNVSQGRESFPSCWGAFPAPGFLPQSLGSVSSSGIPSSVAEEHFQLRETFPSRWGAFPASGILPQLLAEYRPGHFQVGGRRELDIFAVAVHKGDGMPGGFDHRSIVGEERRVGLVVSITK